MFHSKTEFVKLQKKCFVSYFFGIKQKLLQKIEIREYFGNKNEDFYLKKVNYGQGESD